MVFKKFLLILSIPLVTFLVFNLTFGTLGPALSNMLSEILDICTTVIDGVLKVTEVPTLIRSLVIDGICPGVCSVLSFVPTIAVLFFFLAILSESGYMDHLSRLLDTPFRAIGLTGASAVPMIMGFGCSVPAILAAGSLPSLRDRYITMLLIPFMSCSAKLPIYGMLASAFFPERVMQIICLVYFLGIVVAVFCSLILNRFIFKKKSVSDSATSCSYSKAFISFSFAIQRISAVVVSASLGFVKKAFTVILIASVVIWFLKNFTLQLGSINYQGSTTSISLEYTTSPGNSFLAELGKLVAPAFAPLGFDDWRAAAALITGLSAKEAVVSTFAILSEKSKGAGFCTACTSGDPLNNMLSEIFTPASAFSFMIFCLLYAPCIATLAAIRKQTGSIKFSLGVLLGQTALAWVIAFIVFNILSFHLPAA